jgi:hypothetical protein
VKKNASILTAALIASLNIVTFQATHATESGLFQLQAEPKEEQRCRLLLQEFNELF